MVNYVAVDLGYGYVKAISSNGKRVVFPSLVGQGNNLSLADVFGKQEDGLDNIHIMYEDNDWFVGELAKNESLNLSRVFERERFEHDYTHILLNVAIQIVTEGNTEPIFLTSGLPLDFYKAQAKDFQTSILGVQPKVKWKSGLLKGREIESVIEKALVFPQGVSAIYSALVNHDGRYLYPELMKEGTLIALIDVGFRTTDFVVVEINSNGSFKPITRLSGTVDDGIVNLHRDIRNYYKTETGGADLKESYINRILRDSKILYKGKELDFAKTIATSKKAIVANIVDRLQNVWSDESDLFDKIFLAGGGGSLLEDYLQPHFDNRLEVVKESQFANAIGYLRLGKAIFDKKAQ